MVKTERLLAAKKANKIRIKDGSIMIEPNQLKLLRERLGLSSQKAAEIVGISARQWQKYEHDDNVNIPENVLEFFCLKLQLPFPLVDDKGALFNIGHAKTIVITSESGGCGKTSLSSDIGILLMKEKYRVLLIDASYLQKENKKRISTLKRVRECHGDLKLDYPEVKTLDEVEGDIERIMTIFDYIIIDARYEFIDLIKSIMYLNIVIVPTFILPKEIKSTIKIIKNARYEKNITNIHTLIIGYDPCYSVNAYEVINSNQIIEKISKHNDEMYENAEMLFENIISNNIDVFDAFTTVAYKRKLESESFKNSVTLLHQSPNCWAVKELKSIKNEIKRKIYVGSTN